MQGKKSDHIVMSNKTSNKVTRKSLISRLKDKKITGIASANKKDLLRLNQLINLNLVELKILAKALGIKKYYKLNKSILIKSILSKEKQPPPVPPKPIKPPIPPKPIRRRIPPVPLKPLPPIPIKKKENVFLTKLRKDISKLEERSKIFLTKLRKDISELEETDSINIPIKQSNLEDILKVIFESIDPNGLYTIKAGDRYITLNPSNIDKFYEKLMEGLIGFQTYSTSLEDIIESILLVEKLKLKRLRIRNNQEGGFFRYTVNYLDKDGDYSMERETAFSKYLEPYGLFGRIEKENYVHNCLYKAFERAGFSDQELEKLKQFVKSRYVPIKNLKEIANKMQCFITLRKMELENFRVKKLLKYGNSNNKKINLGLIDKHYFIIEKTEITSFAIRNLNKIPIHINNWNRIFAFDRVKKRFNFCDRFIDSFQLVKILLINKEELLKPIKLCRQLYGTQYYDQQDDFKNLKYLSDEVKIESHLGKSDKLFNNVIRFFFDFETTTEGTHKPYCCSVIDDKTNIVKTFHGLDCGKQLLDYVNNLCVRLGYNYNFKSKKFVRSNVIMIAHNAEYDMRCLYKYIGKVNILYKGNGIVSGTVDYRQIRINIKDSYKLIPFKLGSFGSIFKLDCDKEVMPYGLYTEENIAKKYCKISEACSFLKTKDDKEQLIKNIDSLRLRFGKDEFDIIGYAQYYCEMDVKVLKQGYHTFREWMRSLTSNNGAHGKGFNIDYISTISSLADKYLYIDGCYDDVYRVSGVVRSFIQKCVVGGRTMCNNNKKQYFESDGKDFMQDFDAVSLYPSAMERMNGFLRGKPNIIKNSELNYDSLSKYDGFFVEAIVTKVGIKVDFPLLSFKTKNGVREFSNDMVGKRVFIDKISMEDCIKYQGMDFDIKRGYYFNDGFNDRIKKTIRYLFNARLDKKKVGCPSQLAYKLIMNSAYGKTILKEITTEIKIMSKDRGSKYIAKNYNYIKEFNKFSGDKVKITTYKPINEHFTYPHVGVEILSMSKRIMNEVFDCANKIGAKVYYQDTDSMHILGSKISYLSETFSKIYGRKLIGKDLGQFHSDFEMSDPKAMDVKATRSLFLGKKCYIDELVGNLPSGDRLKEYHIRLKGIPTSSINYTAKKQGIDVFELYEKMYKGDEIDFDLLEGGSRVRFLYHYDGSVTSMDGFFRKFKLR